MAERFATSWVTSGVPMLVIVIEFGAAHCAEQKLTRQGDRAAGAPPVRDMRSCPLAPSGSSSSLPRANPLRRDHCHETSAGPSTRTGVVSRTKQPLFFSSKCDKLDV